MKTKRLPTWTAGVIAVGVAMAIVALFRSMIPVETQRQELASEQTSARLGAKVGWYETVQQDLWLVTWAADGQLRLISFDDEIFSHRLVPVSDSSFRWIRGEGKSALLVEFSQGQAGQVTGFKWKDEGGATRTATRTGAQEYAVRELWYQNGEVALSGSLLVPSSETAHPTAVMIHGSGTSDRDNLWYMYIAHMLAQGGVAVLLPDKRGSGKSGGEWRTAGFDDFARDTRAAVEAVREQPGVDPSRVGLLGISQGGWIAPLTASITPGLAFVINVSGAAVTPNEQLGHELRGNPVSVWFAKQRRRVWWSKNGDFDPIPYWEELDTPALIVYGEEDEEDNVPVARSVGLLERAQGGNSRLDLTIEVFPETGHGLFQRGTRRIRRDFLDLLVGWIKEKTDQASAD